MIVESTHPGGVDDEIVGCAAPWARVVATFPPPIASLVCTVPKVRASAWFGAPASANEPDCSLVVYARVAGVIVHLRTLPVQVDVPAGPATNIPTVVVADCFHVTSVVCKQFGRRCDRDFDVNDGFGVAATLFCRVQPAFSILEIKELWAKQEIFVNACSADIVEASLFNKDLAPTVAHR